MTALVPTAGKHSQKIASGRIQMVVRRLGVMRIVRRVLAAFVCLAIFTAAAVAQEWPAPPVTMIVPTAAGGGADILGRILAARLSELLGKPVIIENVGNAVAATNRIAKGVPDGYHFNLGNTAHFAFHPTIYKTPVYNPRTDF